MDKSRACKLKTLIESEQSEKSKLVKKRINEILKNDERMRTKEEKRLLREYKTLAKSMLANKKSHQIRKEREIEREDDLPTLKQKCVQLVEMIRSHENIVVYTGAGISTSASIPDYRGPNGVWTQLKNGADVSILAQVNDLALATPTFTHMALSELVKRNMVKHVVSQNCDGLHRRSGLPACKLSEVHGNMYVEVCEACKTPYLRSFDVTEKTTLRKHKTLRKCHKCTGDLIDTIVHFGEKGKLACPLNWPGAVEAANKADLIICMGTSLKILRKYSCLWPASLRKRECKLVIINLQWTPKDSQAVLKLNSRCDSVMRQVMQMLDIPVPQYSLPCDPLILQGVRLKHEERGTCNRIQLQDLLEDKQIEESKINTTPAWFGKGIRRK